MPKEVIVKPDISVEIIDSPIPEPNENQVVIKVVVAGTNPKDWKVPKWFNKAHNSGDDIAGTVHSIGSAVTEFKPGDRVAAFHEMVQPHGAFAEYALAWDYTTFHLPARTGFEEAATIPLAALTSVVALFAHLGLREPWTRADGDEVEAADKVPLLIYGVTSATGAFAAQLARLAPGVGPIIGVAGRNQELAKKLSDHVVDYRNGEDALIKGVEEVLQKEGLGSKVRLVYDAISENGSWEAIARVVDPNGGKVTSLLPPAEGFKYPDGVEFVKTSVGDVHGVRKDLGYVWSRFFSRALADGRFKAHPYEVIPGGLEGVQVGLKNLVEGKASGLKYVYRVQDTPGAGQ